MIGEFVEISNCIQNVGSFSIGRIKLEGNSNLSKYNATIIARNNIYCNIEGEIGKNNYNTIMIFSDGNIYNIKSLGHDNTISQIGSTLSFVDDIIKRENSINNLLPSIYDSNNNVVGNCKLINEGVGISKYLCTKYIINNNILSCYEDGGAGSTIYRNVIILYKELLSKYNLSFIELIKSKVGINNLPENMSLVGEKISESKNSIGGKSMKIVFIVFFIITLVGFLS